MSVEQSDSRTATRARPVGWRIGLIAVVTVIVALIPIGWWASQQGYVSWFGTACTSEGYDPIPSDDELVAKFHKSPYCARLVRDETSF